MNCRKRAWLDAHRRELARPPDAAMRLRLTDGHHVGRIARELWAGGVLVTEPSARHARAAARTSLLLEDASVGAIFEGAFAHDGLRIRADVIVRGGSSFELVEVKSASRPRDDHVLDLAIQAYVIDGSGVELESASLLHLNPAYVWGGGAQDLRTLFVRVDLTKEVFDLLPEVRTRGRDFRAVLEARVSPSVAMGPQCRQHDVCQFFDFCRRESGATAARAPELATLAAVAALPAGADAFSLSLLDVQSFSTALPRIAGTSPHERVPFLWSLRNVHADGTVEDRQGLAPFGCDPRASFAETLAAALPERGRIAFFSDATLRVIEGLAGSGMAAASSCARRLATDGIDVRARLEHALGRPGDTEDWTWEALTAVAPVGSSRSFGSRREAAAAYVEAIDGPTPRARRDAIAEALTRYGRENVKALAVLSGIAHVGPRV